jgi:hypothetical protein
MAKHTYTHIYTRTHIRTNKRKDARHTSGGGGHNKRRSTTLKCEGDKRWDNRLGGGSSVHTYEYKLTEKHVLLVHFVAST